MAQKKNYRRSRGKNLWVPTLARSSMPSRLWSQTKIFTFATLRSITLQLVVVILPAAAVYPSYRGEKRRRYFERVQFLHILLKWIFFNPRFPSKKAAAKKTLDREKSEVQLVGGFNPFEKCWLHGMISPNKGEHTTSLKPPLRNITIELHCPNHPEYKQMYEHYFKNHDFHKTISLKPPNDIISYRGSYSP